MTDALDILVDGYLDGSLSTPDAGRLAGALRAGGAEAGAVRDRIALAGLLGLALDPVDGRAVARGISERLRAADGSVDFSRELRRRLARQPGRTRAPRRRGRRSPTWWLASGAAAVLAIAALCWLSMPAAQPEPAWTVQAGASAPSGVDDGAHLILPDGGTLSARDGTRLACEPGTIIDLALTGSGPLFTLRGGALDADVAPQTPERPLSILTEEARVTVVGTRFRIARRVDGTRLAMHAGTVRLDRLTEGRTELVGAGATALVPAAATPSPAIADPPWRPLFTASDLAGWNGTTGRWSNDQGVVRGEAVAGAKARIETAADVADLELTCRMRISGPRPGAEIQVGDYNWFAKVPAGAPGAWIAVTLRQHGATLTATADGRPLEIEAGDGRAPRPGKLAFYVGIGGIVEIADGRLRSWPVPP